MNTLRNGGPPQTASATLQKPLQNTMTASQIESLSRLHGDRTILIDHAEQLVIDMKSRVPDGGLRISTLQQMEGRRLHGELCTHIIVFADSHAVLTDTSTSIVIAVVAFGRRRTTLIGAVR